MRSCSLSVAPVRALASIAFVGLVQCASGRAASSDAATVVSGPAPPPDDRCFVVYVHGRHDRDLSPGAASDADRRAYWQPTPGSLDGDFVEATSRLVPTGRLCETLVVGYDGRAAFFDEAAAGTVASQIAEFVEREAIPDSRVILIAHSMGGLVIRSILNRPLLDPDYALVEQKTKYAITIATPHLGSPAADALAGMSGAPCADLLAALLEFTGLQSADRAAISLTRSFLEEGSAPGGSMGDRQRTRRIYTIATTGRNRGTGMPFDDQLARAWSCLGLAETPGDGLVTKLSALGIYERTGAADGFSWTSGAQIEGLLVPWVWVELNHNHARFSDESALIHNMDESRIENLPIGEFIAEYGLSLE